MANAGKKNDLYNTRLVGKILPHKLTTTCQMKNVSVKINAHHLKPLPRHRGKKLDLS